MITAKSALLRTTLLAAGGVAVLTLAACSDDGSGFDVSKQFGANPTLPEPQQELVPDLKVAEVIGWSGGQMPKVPDGLKVSAFATDLANPRTVHTLPNGDVLVAQSEGPGVEPLSRPKDMIRGWIMNIAHGGGGTPKKKSNLITLLRDTNRDGTVDERFDLLTDLASPFGLAWKDDTLYVADTNGVLAYPYKLGDTKITAQPRIVTPLPGGPIDHHWTKDLALSPDGNFLYASVGSNSNIVENGLEAEKGRAAIWQIDIKTGAARVFASGLRNPNGLSFQPDSGELYAVANERDELGPNLVPDYMTSVKDGAFYGWPWSYYGQHVDPRVHPQRPDMVAKAIPADYALSSHVAALGMTFSKGSALPAAYADGAFIGEHGSWNRDAFNGYKVVFVPFQNGKPQGPPQDVVTGFIEGDKAHGRPVGVGIDGTGALLVCDDVGNTVWRVANGDGTISAKPVATDDISATFKAPIAANAATPSEGTANATTASTTGTAAPAANGEAASSGGNAAASGSAAPSGGSTDEQLTGQTPAGGQGAAASPTPSQTQIAPAAP